MNTQGDPRLILTANGSSLQFTGGQPIMDTGLENLALISLFTGPGWVGNQLLVTGIGSDFEAACNQPITRQALNDIRDAAKRALNDQAFGDVQVSVSNPVGHRLEINIRIAPPGENPQAIQLNRNGENWTFQALNPAYLRVNR